MNAKILKGKSAGGLISYLNDMRAKDAKVIFANGISTTSNQSVVTAFNLQWANGSSKIKDKMGHLVISFSPKDRDKISDELATRLCQEYMKQMHFPPTIYIGYRHLDHEHDHIHIAYSRVDNNGKAITCDTNYARSVSICKALREKYGLAAPSMRKKDVNRDRLKGKDKVKFLILDTVFLILDRAKSWREFINELAKQGIEVSLIKGDDGKARGIVYTSNNLSFAGAKVDKELSYSSICNILGQYDLEITTTSNQDRLENDPNTATTQDCNHSITFSDTEILSNSESNNCNENFSSDSSLGDAMAGAAIEIVMQPHQTPSSGGGGGNDDDDNKKKREKENYVSYKRRR